MAPSESEKSRVPADPKTLESFERTIEGMHLDGELSTPALHQCYVSIASEYLCQHHDADRAFMVLNKCPVEYLSDILPDQMRSDPQFAKVVVEMTHRLTQLGYVGGETDSPNHPPAQA